MISKTVFVLVGPFREGLNGEGLDAVRVATSIARGLTASGRLECDLCPLEEDLGARTSDPSEPLKETGFDRRMHAARVVVIACARLDDRTLVGSIAFEAATRARQSGVPAYAIAGSDALDPFEARIVDLQVILQASTQRELNAAGKQLAELL